MKKLIEIAFLVLICLFAVSCTAKAPLVSVEDYGVAMLSAGSDYLPSMTVTASDKDSFEQLFPSYDYEKVDSYYLAYSSEGKADEILLVRMKNTSDVQSMTEAVQEQLSSRVKMFSFYSPEQSKRAEEGKVYASDTDVLLIVADNVNEIYKAYTDYTPVSDNNESATVLETESVTEEETAVMVDEDPYREIGVLYYETTLTEDTFDDIKELYFEYLKENDLLREDYSPKSASELSVQRFVGTFGDGCIVAYMGGDGLNYTEALRCEQYGDNTIVFCSGQIYYAFYKDNVYTIGQAYEKGILSDDDILTIDSIVGIHE